jgi:hypothetical protein
MEKCQEKYYKYIDKPHVLPKVIPIVGAAVAGAVVGGVIHHQYHRRAEKKAMKKQAGCFYNGQPQYVYASSEPKIVEMPPVYTYGNNSCGCNRRY